MACVRTPPDASPWYRGVTRYQWGVLSIASLGWIFDVFEGQIFVASMNEAMPSLVPAGTGSGTIALYNNVAFGAFLLGGALGGIYFGRMGDRVGRKRAMVWTIATYSLFTLVSAFAQTWWQMAICRFLVAMGTGGEWAVASALVAEVFPERARARALAMFHASSVLGAYLAAAAGAVLVANPAVGWRWGFALGAAPAVLILWVRSGLQEPERWERSRAAPQAAGLLELFKGPWRRRTLVGTGLATIGLATFWGVHVYGKDRLRDTVTAEILGSLPASATEPERQKALESHFPALKRSEMLGFVLTTTGALFGMLLFGPLCERIGRKGAFLFYSLGGLLGTWTLFHLCAGVTAVMLFLPAFGFLTGGMHGGFAIYFPELFPTRLRGTGAGFCFNGGRILAAPVLFASGWMQKDGGFTREASCSLLSLLFALVAVFLLFAPETRGKDLPE